MTRKILVCGSQSSKDYRGIVFHVLLTLEGNFEIVEGCCKQSADQYAEEFAIEYGCKIHHYPSTSGNYLQRSIERVQFADEVIAFWDHFSYGTSQAIATAVRLGKPVRIIEVC